MPTQCFKPIRGKRLRLTLLDTCGVPATAEDCGQVVTSGFVTVSLTSEVETGDEFVQKNANGDLCVNERSPDLFKRYTVTAEFCDVDPDLFAIATGATQETDPDGDNVGFRISEGSLEQNFALEVWTGISGQDCADGEEYGYLLLPFVTGATFGDLEVGNSNINFTIQGAYTKEGQAWGSGPYDVVPTNGGSAGPLPDPITAGQHLLMRTTNVAPPDPACGCVQI